MYTDARGCRRTWRLPSRTRRYKALPTSCSYFFHYVDKCGDTLRWFLWLVEFEHAALDSDDLLYLKEQMEAEEDAERLLRRTEKRAFAAFKISFCLYWIIIFVTAWFMQRMEIGMKHGNAVALKDMSYTCWRLLDMGQTSHVRCPNFYYSIWKFKINWML